MAVKSVTCDLANVVDIVGVNAFKNFSTVHPKLKQLFCLQSVSG